MIFEYALPRLLPSGGYDETRLYNKMSQSEYFDDVLEVSDEMKYEIVKEGFEKWLVKISTDGNIIKTVLE